MNECGGPPGGCRYPLIQFNVSSAPLKALYGSTWAGSNGPPEASKAAMFEVKTQLFRLNASYPPGQFAPAPGGSVTSNGDNLGTSSEAMATRSPDSAQKAMPSSTQSARPCIWRRTSASA